ncbi:Rnf213, partial [Symbiodinium microadriaticum]
MGLIQSNLNGDASENEFLKSLPAVEVFSYQCSPLSTSAGIEQVFESARRYHCEASNTVVVVLLDEVGLAEQSPHLPLKVLHKMLDDAVGGESVVGISNWSLDPAKMNRAVHLYRPAPTVDDLSLTAEGMVRSANLKGYLHELARAYNYIYLHQAHADFWGLREFYSTVRAINNALAKKKEDNKSGDAVALDSAMLMNS